MLAGYRWFAGAIPALVGAADLAGWWLGVAPLTRAADSWPAMKPLTGMLCVLSGVALLLGGAAPGTRARAAGKGLAAAGGVLSLLALAERVGGFDSGLDRLLAGRAVGRPLARTALCFLLLSASTLSLDRLTRRGHSVGQCLAFVAGSIAAVSVIGYAFGISELFGPERRDVVSGMAFHTASAILLLSSGLLVARPDVGLVSALVSEHAGGLASRRLLLGLVTFAPVAIFVVTGRRLGWYSEQVVTALLVFLALIEGTVLILLIAKKLNAYDQRLSQLVTLAPDGIFTANLDGRYLDVNAAGTRLLGRPREEIVGRNIVDFIAPEQAARLWEERERLLGGGTATAEWSIRHGQGHYVDVEVSATILPDGRWQAFMRDVSERKRFEVALAAAREAEARQLAWLRNIIDQMPEGVIIIDMHARPVVMNRVVRSFTPERLNLLEGATDVTLLDLRLPDGSPVPRAERPSVRALELGEFTLAKELAVSKDDGALLPILVSAAPIRDEAGLITGATVVVQDITPLKELERLREEWASVIAHDLRQPVNAISLSAATLQRLCGPEAPDKVRTALRRIEAGAARLDRMISDLSDASRIEANRMELSPQAVDLGAFIGGVADGLREATEGRAIVVEATPGQWAWIDPDRIQQVLTNLIANAAKYGQAGTDIRVEVLDHDDMLEVGVTNQGPGIPADEIPRLFNRFGRTRGARASGAPGTGLGLYIARSLVEAHGGRIWVDSAPGETTTFHFLVARAPAGARPGASPPPAG